MLGFSGKVGWSLKALVGRNQHLEVIKNHQDDQDVKMLLLCRVFQHFFNNN